MTMHGPATAKPVQAPVGEIAGIPLTTWRWILLGGGLDYLDVAAEKTRIARDIGKADKEITTLERKLGNADFLAKAPDDVVAEQKARLAEEQSRRQRLADALATLDQATGHATLAALMDWAAASESALVVATHDLGIARLFDKVWLMDHGHLSLPHQA